MTASRTYRIASIGAGVQSTVMALIMDLPDDERPRQFRKKGYPKPDIAYFADTGWEPEYVYEHLNWLETQLSYPLERVVSGNIRDNLRRAVTPSGHSFIDVPLYLTDSNGKKGMLRRQCTNHYKVTPILKAARKLAGGKPRTPLPRDVHVEMWLGISTDEASRMKPSRDWWISHDYPLIAGEFSRTDCEAWFAERYPGRLLPRSACVICPFRSDAHWLQMREHAPDAFEEACAFDRYLRSRSDIPIRRIIEGTPYLHNSCTPLETAIARAAKNNDAGGGFGNECEGLCGV